MFYRQAGIRHTSYKADTQALPIPFDRVQLGIVLLLAVSAPLWISKLYLNGYLLPWVIWGTATLGLNLLMGWAGQVHLGYGAVMAIGAYTSIHLMRIGLPFELVLVGSGLASAVIGLIFGAAALRVKGLYLAVSTLALQFVIDWVLVHISAISGGVAATLQAPYPRVLGVKVESDIGLYYLALAWCMIVTVFMINLKRSGLGRALVAVREKDYAAEILGISAFYYKGVAFWCSSFLGGVTGAMLGFTFYRAITPYMFNLEVSIRVLAMVIIGGLGSVIGSFMGAGLILLTPIILNNLVNWAAVSLGITISVTILNYLPLILYGGLIVSFLLVEPLGLAKIYDNLRNYFLVWPFSYAKR
ncbi:MAG: branched-chain amino acid ABC transporter permease [Deltaproteobacteria bacterium]|nr:branched-chain amino acid ABC transporter permease [Deltaproteobacteria bacterium]